MKRLLELMTPDVKYSFEDMWVIAMRSGLVSDDDAYRRGVELWEVRAKRQSSPVMPDRQTLVYQGSRQIVAVGLSNLLKFAKIQKTGFRRSAVWCRSSG